jgi:signal transduction histidine kinase
MVWHMNEQIHSPLLLVVDDEPANLSLLKRLFEPHYRVMCVTRGQEALDLLAQAPFDLVVLDIMMPEMNGIETLSHIRSKANTADLPVILVSALSEVDDIVRGLQLGANDYITKPVEIDLMLARVQTQLTVKRLQDERKQHIYELQAAHEMKDRFLQMASHDLKGPLGNIGMSQFLLRRLLADNSEAIELLDMIEDVIENMDHVIKDFLDSAALQSGKLDLQLQNIAVEEIIYDILEQYKFTAQKKQIELHASTLPGIINVDRQRTAQVVNNLVSNAIKYSQRGSFVTLWAKQAPGVVRIFVADQGPGIPADEQDQLFTQFGKLSTRPTEGENSTGLGLWIVKHLVTIQNGQVGFDCPSEGGTIFWIELPAAEESVSARIAG